MLFSDPEFITAITRSVLTTVFFGAGLYVWVRFGADILFPTRYH